MSRPLSEVKENVINFVNALATYNCTRCTYCSTETRKCIPRAIWHSTEKQLRPVVIVSNYPKHLDQDQGKILRTAEKEVMNNWLSAAGFHDFYATNAFKCVTVDDLGPKRAHLGICPRNYLWREIHAIKPHVVISLGRIAFQSLHISIPSDEDASELMLRTFDHALPPIKPFTDTVRFKLYTSYHPAFMQRTGSEHNESCISIIKQAFEENLRCQTTANP